MFHLPELVEQVVFLFDNEEHLAACTQVSRAWRQAFIPLYWRRIDDKRESRHGRTFRTLWFKGNSRERKPQSRDESLARRNYLEQFLHHVQHLYLRFPWTLDLFLGWSITRQRPTELLVLTLDNWGNIPCYFPISNQSESTESTGPVSGIFSLKGKDQQRIGQENADIPDVSCIYNGSLSPQQQEALLSRVPKWTLRTPTQMCSRFPEQERFSRGLWLLIQSSPQLTRLTFSPYSESTICAPDLSDIELASATTVDSVKTAKEITDSTPSFSTKLSPGAQFLALVLKSHKNLFHFQPSLHLPEEIVLEVMAQEQRRGGSNIKSYSSLRSRFILPSDSTTWSLVRDRLLNTGICRLTLGNHFTTASRVRFFLEIFPNLEELHLIAVIVDGTAKAEENEILVNTSLRKLSISLKAFGLASCRVLFEGLKEFEAPRLGHEIWDLVPLLRWSMPRCEVFRVGVSDSWRHKVAVLPSSILNDIQSLERQISSSKEKELPIRELALRLKPFRPIPDIVWAIQWMPFLTNVEFRGNLGVEVLEMMAQHCPNLQRFKVTKMLGLCSKALCLLLRSCKDLVSVQGPDLALRAADVIRSQPWVCSGMQEFSCRILGIPRLMASEEQELNQSDMGLEEVRLEEAAERAKWEQDGGGGREGEKEEITENEEKDGPRQQRKRRIAQLCRRRKLLMYRLRSREIQHQIFSVLATWTELKVLDLGYYRSDYYRYNYRRELIHRCRPNTLEWNFDSGVEQLSKLKELRAVYIHKFEHRVGDGERQWMRDNWPRLRAGSLMDRP